MRNICDFFFVYIVQQLNSIYIHFGFTFWNKTRQLHQTRIYQQKRLLVSSNRSGLLSKQHHHSSLHYFPKIHIGLKSTRHSSIFSRIIKECGLTERSTHSRVRECNTTSMFCSNAIKLPCTSNSYQHCPANRIHCRSMEHVERRGSPH